MSDKRILVLGGGGIGGYIGGRLTSAGCEVTIADQWPEHVEAMREKGLRIGVRDQSNDVVVPVTALHLHELQRLDRPFDVVCIAVKSYDTDWSAALARRHLADDGVALSCQNGLNDEAVAAAVGRERTLGCVVTVAGELLSPGHVIRADSYNVGFRVGELDGGPTSRVGAIVELLDRVAVTEPTANLVGQRWAKLATNTMVNVMSGLSGYSAGQVRARDDTLPVLVFLGAETVSVGEALGVSVEPVMGLEAARLVHAVAGKGRDELLADIRQVARNTGGHRASMLQDVLKGRRTEIDHLNGAVWRLGVQVGIDTPFNRAATQIVAGVAPGKLTADPVNIAPLVSMAAERWS